MVELSCTKLVVKGGREMEIFRGCERERERERESREQRNRERGEGGMGMKPCT